ncbi:MAG: flagellar assembly protein FliW [Bryobacteraceae bacterium]|nr:flagellar assembly protein FliW [Bryobacteraceae bacterium]
MVPLVVTPRFGAIDYPESAVIHFPAGLPAFEHHRHFLALERPDAAPILFLQSLTDVTLCLHAVPVRLIDPAYELHLLPDDLRLLGLSPAAQPAIGGDLVCLAVLHIPSHGPPTANLLAPVVIRRDSHLGVQAVQVDTAYTHAHPLFAVEAAC